MQFSVTGKHVDIGNALRGHVEKNLGAAVAKYFDRAMDANVVFSKNGQNIQTDISVRVGRGIMLRGKAEAEDSFAAFNAASEHIAKRLRRYKRRIRDHHKSEDQSADALLAQQYVLADQEEHEPAADDQDHVVVAEMATEIPMIKVSEAVMRMNLADLPAMMFRNAAHGGLNMIYRRPDGNIGWVDPRGTRERAR